MTKQNVIDNVQASMASLFTKEDVINIINSIEQPAPAPATDYLTLLRAVIDRVRNMALLFEWDDKSSIGFHDLEFSIGSGNTIELDDYTIDATDLKDNFLYELGILYDDLKDEHEQRTEIVNNNKTKYPFNEGDEYFTIEFNEIICSCWDDVSEEMYRPDKKYFRTHEEAAQYLNQQNN